MPPKHDLRGGRISEDSFAMSNKVFETSMNRCFLARSRQKARKDQVNSEMSHKHWSQVVDLRPMGLVSEECQT